MNSKTLNIFIAIFLMMSLVVSVGAEGDIIDSSGEISIKQITENVEEIAEIIELIEVIEEDTTNHISEGNEFIEERVESLTPEDATSENLGADPGQKEEGDAPISSQEENNTQKEIQYIPLEEVLDETSSSPTQENESQEQNEVSGQEEIESSLGQEEVIENFNQTVLSQENEEELHTDVRGNTQKDTGGSSSSPPSNPELENPVSLSSLNQEENVEYISLSEIIGEIDEIKNLDINETNNGTYKSLIEINQEIEDSDVLEKRLYSYYSEGKKVIEIETFREVEINKEEFEESEYEKRVVISSEEHIDDPLRVYVDMQTEVLKDKIKIYWQNEDLDITKLDDFSVKYYDENDNGLVDRISWIVPHLSEQIFEIIIENQFFEMGGQTSIEIINLTVPSDPITNPIEFKFKINYENISDVSCYLEINQTLENHVFAPFGNVANASNVGGSFELGDGDYTWVMKCIDPIGNTESSTSSSFQVDENFDVTNITGDLFFLDLVENEIQNQRTVTISSNYDSNMTITLKKGASTIHSENQRSLKIYSLALNETLLDSSGNYELIVDFEGKNSVTKTISQTFSVASANIIFTPGTYEINENIGVNFIIEAPGKTISNVILRSGNGNDDLIGNSGDSLNENEAYSYPLEGNYQISLETTIIGVAGTFILEKPGINIINSGDTTPPDVDLIYPGHNVAVYSDEIIFEYEANDEEDVKECIFTLYNITGSRERELYTQKDDPENGKVFEVHMVDFDQGEYEWEVNCSDNSNNWEEDFNVFEVIFGNSSASSSSSKFTNYELKEEVEEVIGEINAFLIDEEKFEADIKEVLDDLGISEDIDFYKKRLLQIDLYFKENYKYVDSETLLEQKNKEYTEEFENIKNKIPKSIEIIDSFEYVKNTVEIDMVNLVEDYMESTNTQISKGFAKKLAQMNLKLQQDVSVEADIKEIKIKYGNETLEFILVKKKVDLMNSQHDQLLEIIPKDIAEDAEEVIFLVDNQIIKKDPIFEILKEDLTDNNEIIYYIEKSIDLEDFSKTETILFEEAFKGNSGVTGFFAGGIITNTDPIYFMIAIFLLICLIVLFIFVFKKKRVQNWKKEPNVVKCFELLRKAGLYLKEKDVERARENYREIKRIYPVLPPRPKEFFYEKMKELSIGIDRRDIFGLVREYEEARKRFNKDDCLRIYAKIKKVYERLPLKDRQKIFERINK
jgi:hypothetical protein